MKHLSAPLSVLWELTNICNLRCKHCYASSGTARIKELTTDEAKNLLEELHDMGVLQVSFTGGEPILRPDFIEIAEFAHSLGFRLGLLTNGTIINQMIAKKIAECFRFCQVTLYAISPKNHDWFVGAPNSFDKTVNGIKLLLDQNVSVGINMPVFKINFKEVNDVFRLAVELGVKRFAISKCLPLGRGKQLDSLLVEQNEYLMAVQSLYRAYTSEGIPISLDRVLSQAFKGLGREPRSLGELFRFKNCTACRTFCAISADGYIVPCTPFTGTEYYAGNVREEKFRDIWRASELFQKLRNPIWLRGKCKNCPELATCQHRCIVEAYAYFNDIMAPDPDCEFQVLEDERYCQRS